MVEIWIERSGDSWFAVAARGEFLVATAVDSSEESVLAAIKHHIPSGIQREVAAEGSPSARKAIRLLVELEAGEERNKRFVLCEECLAEPLRRVLYAAASIPLGYVTSYGNIASVTGVIARRVGRVMATNPLYPIVPCHRVVGSDMGLVGYGGHQDEEALRAKLARLRAETRGFGSSELLIDGRPLRLYPVERAIMKAARDLPDPARQLTLF